MEVITILTWCPASPAVQPEEGEIATGCSIVFQLYIVQWLLLTHT